MGGSKLRKAIGAVKDQTSIGLAKVGSSADLDVAIVKATRHHEYPPDERYVREILNLTSYSPTLVSCCVSTISRRLSKTKNWVVALKSLMLIHRLLSEGDAAFEHEIFFSTRRGTRLLNMSDFRDASARSNSWDYSAFVRTYALYLDEQLERRMQNRRGSHSSYVCHVDKEEDDGYGNALILRGTPLCELKTEVIFSRVNHLMQLLERFLACRPTGAARDHRIVSVALYPQMVKVHQIFSRVSKQYDEVDSFYAWCKLVGIARSFEYPDVEKISQKRLDMMYDYIHGKSAMGERRRSCSPEQKPKTVEEAEPEQDMSSIKALPPPPPPEVVEEKESEEEHVEEPKEEKVKTQEEGDLLNLGEDAPTTIDQGDKLALALFDDGLGMTAPDGKTTPWGAFEESSSSGDWETALVQSASLLSNQKVSLPGGFDTLILNGLYQQGEMAQAVASSGITATGSASSVALGSAGRPAMLALPAPPSDEGGDASSGNFDPFAASLSIAPPPYVQMSEMEKKQQFLVQEQIMWQQYARDGMQGQVGLSKASQNSNPFNMGDHTMTY